MEAERTTRRSPPLPPHGSIAGAAIGLGEERWGSNVLRGDHRYF